MTTGWPTIRRNVTIWHFHFRLLRHMPFCQIPRHSVVMGGRIYYYSTRLGETILMSYVASFHDLWKAHNSVKCQHNILLNYVSSSGRSQTNHSSLESSH